MNAIVVGHGKMGAVLEQMLSRQADAEVLGVVDAGLFERPEDVPGKADVLIDFSHPDNLEMILNFARESGCALVLGTTGYAPEQLARIREVAECVAVVHSSNYSLGVAVLRKAVALVAPMLLEAGFDAEIVEAHHNQKADAPSGTAKLLLEAMDPEGAYARVYGRAGRPGKRGKEIGVHALRGGTVAGTHSVFFFGEDEAIELRHSASSRRIFAAGAVRAAQFIYQKAPGLYGMDDVLGGAI